MKVSLSTVSPLKTTAKKFFTKGVQALKNKPLVAAIPLVTVPLVVYDVKNYNTKKLLDSLKEKEIKVPKNITVSPITNSGLSESSKTKIRRAIDEAEKKGKITEKEKKDLKSKVNFTGKEGEEVVDTEQEVKSEADSLEGDTESIQESDLAIMDEPDAGELLGEGCEVDAEHPSESFLVKIFRFLFEPLS